MADTELEKLSIKIEADGEKETSSKLSKILNILEKIGSVAQNTSTQVNSATKAFSNLSNSSNNAFASINKLQSSLSQATATVNSFASSFNNTSATTSNVSNSLNNIASTVSSVTSGFSALTTAANSANIVSFTTNITSAVPSVSSLGNSATTASSKIDRMSTELAELANKGDEVKSKFSSNNMFASWSSKAKTKIEEVKDKMGELAENATKTSKLQSALSRITGIFSNMALTLNGWFEESNDYVESVNLFAVTMGKSADKAKEFADSIEDMGIDLKDWMEYQGSFNQITLGYGVEEDISNEMSQQLTQLAYDLSSLWNVDTDTAFQKLQSGMSGQIKGLKDWGINLSIASLRETALAHGITKSTASMTEAEKAMLRYVTLMEKTANVQNDMARTLITPANSMRILENQITKIKRALGNIVSVIVAEVLPVVIVAAEWLAKLAETIAKFFGYELPTVDTSGIESIATTADEATDNIDNTTDSMKELKRQLMGFDEINKLSSDTSSSTSSGTASAGASPLDMDISGYDYDFTDGLVKNTQTNVSAIVGIFTGVTCLLLGIALFVCGQYGLGLALIAYGGYQIAQTMIFNNDAISGSVKAQLAAISLVVSGLLFLVGIILLSCGQVAAGITLMVMGISLFVTTMLSVNGEDWSKKIKSFLAPILRVAGAMLAAIGLILVVANPKTVPAGIILIVAGIASLVAGYAMDGNSDIIGDIKNFLTQILSTVSGLLALIGILVCVMGYPLIGVPLIIAGIALFAVDINNKTDGALLDIIKNNLNAILTVVGSLLAVIGIIVCCFGHPVIGVALIVAGIAIFAIAATTNKDTTSAKVKAFFARILGIAAGCLLVLGILVLLVTGFVPLGIGLIVAGIAAIGGVVALSLSDEAKSKVSEMLSKIGAIISGVFFVALGLIMCLTLVGIPFGLDLIQQGITTIAKSTSDNPEEITTKVKAIFDKIKDIVKGVFLVVLGLIMCLTLVGIPFGLDLMQQGITTIAKSTSDKPSETEQKVKAIFDKIEDLLSGVFLIALGLIMCLTVAGIPYGLNLIEKGASSIAKASKSGDTIVTTIKNKIKEIVKFFVNAINAVIGLVNSIGFDVDLPEWAQELLGTDSKSVSFGFNIPKLQMPKFANGGVIDAGQMFVARESGPELVASVGKGKTGIMNNDQIVDAVSNGVYRATRQAMSESDTNGDINLTVNLDGEPVYKNVVKRNNDEYKLMGRSPLYV